MGTIGDMATSVHYGTSAKAGDRGAWSILRMGNITDDGGIDTSNLKQIDLKNSDVAKYTLKRGDLLFNRTNSVEKVGKSAVVHTDEPFAFAGYLVRVRLHPEYSPDFVAAFLMSSYGSRLRRNLARRAVNQANISASRLRGIQIPIPPSPLQRQFAEEIHQINAQRSRVEAALACDDELFASLQSRAFKGEL
ncbi:restriction endonuclease subunit S [Propionibacterium freudenreichii]|nr:restriction endonuclease subunit S [Propionibacterium freudenreichii]